MTTEQQNGPAPSAPTSAEAAEVLAEIVKAAAKTTGLPCKIQPLVDVVIRVGRHPHPAGTPEDSPERYANISCIGVRLDENYIIVQFPTGSFRAFKADASGKVLDRLDQCRAGFHGHVSRVFSALVWDRLRDCGARYEPLLELLEPPKTPPVLTASSEQIRDPTRPLPAPAEAPPKPAPKPPTTPSAAPTPAKVQAPPGATPAPPVKRRGPSAKLAVVYRAGELPQVDPANPVIPIELAGLKTMAKNASKAARKLQSHGGGAVLQGRLATEDGRLVLLDAGFQWLEPKTEPDPTPPMAIHEPTRVP